MLSPAVAYERRRPEESTLYQVVADNLSTLYGAVDDGALRIALPGFVKREPISVAGLEELGRELDALRARYTASGPPR